MEGGDKKQGDKKEYLDSPKVMKKRPSVSRINTEVLDNEHKHNAIEHDFSNNKETFSKLFEGGFFQLTEVIENLTILKIPNLEVIDIQLKYFWHLTNLKSLNISGNSAITDKGLQHLTEFYNLAELNISDNPNITYNGIKVLGTLPIQKFVLRNITIDIEYLIKFTNLVYLDISGNKTIDKAAFEYITDLPNLRTLIFIPHNERNEKITGKVFKYLTNITYLDLSQNKEIGNDFSYVSKLTSLKILRLVSANLSAESLKNNSFLYISNLVNLNSLNIAYNYNLSPQTVENALSFLPKFTSLDVSGLTYTQQRLDFLWKYSSITYLNISGCVNDINNLFNSFKYFILPRIKILEINNIELSENLKSAISNLPTLETLIVKDTKLDLKKIVIEENPIEKALKEKVDEINAEKITPQEVFEGLSKDLKDVLNINLENLNFNNNIFDYLISIPNLIYLNLSGNKINIILNSISTLENLTELDISNMKLSPDVFKTLVLLTSLENLNVSNMTVSKDLLKSLQLLHIKNLNLSNALNHETLKYISFLTNLKVLDISNNPCGNMERKISKSHSSSKLINFTDFLPQVLSVLHKLEKLNLSGIEFQSGTLECLTKSPCINLKHLNISRNSCLYNILFLETLFNKFEKLEVVVISYSKSNDQITPTNLQDLINKFQEERNREIKFIID